MKKARLRKNELAAQFYWPEGNLTKIAMSAPGMPYVPDQEAYTPLFCEQGYGVLQAQYIGTYDSGGIFTPQSAVETLFQFSKQIYADGILHDLRNGNILQIPKRISALTAHSFGTCIAFNSILNGLDVDLAILFSPMLEYGKNAKEAGLKADLSNHIKHISSALPLTFRLGDANVWNNFFLYDEYKHPSISEIAPLNITKIVCICGKKDPGIDSSISKKYIENLCNNYSHRVELVDYLEVEDGTHDVSTLLTPQVKDFLMNKFL